MQTPAPVADPLSVPCPACGSAPGASCRESRVPIGLDPSEPRPLFSRPPHLKRRELAEKTATMLLLVGASLGLSPIASLQSIAFVRSPPHP